MAEFRTDFFSLQIAASADSGSFPMRDYELTTKLETMQSSRENAMSTPGSNFNSRNTSALISAVVNSRTPATDMSMVEAVAF